MSHEKLLTPARVAEITGLTIGALKHRRDRGQTPAFVQLGKRTPRYTPQAVQDFVANGIRAGRRVAAERRRKLAELEDAHAQT